MNKRKNVKKEAEKEQVKKREGPKRKARRGIVKR